MVETTMQRKVRASVSFPGEHYVELERLASRKKVSVAWVVRDAVDKYLAAQMPLFNNELRPPETAATHI